MVKYCIVCKKQYVPGDRNYVFHCFPTNDEQKQKWLSVIGISRYPVNARVCSDHFDSDSYRLNDSCTTGLKRLLWTAVPKVQRKSLDHVANLQSSPAKEAKCCLINMNANNNLKEDFGKLNNDYQLLTSTISFNSIYDGCNIFHVASEEIVNDLEETPQSLLTFPEMMSNENVQNKNTEVIPLDLHINGRLQRNCTTYDSQMRERKKVCLMNNGLNVTLLKNLYERDHDYCLEKEDQGTLKRIISMDRINETFNPRNKFRWKDGQKIQYFTRQDFTSNGAWNKFLKFLVIKRQQKNALCQKLLRRKKKMSSLEEVVKVLKKRKEEAAADYLQGLPEILKQIIERLKNKKSTIAFPEALKSFARDLRCHSPAAYEMVRKTFLNCLPTAESLNRWENQKNYNQGIKQELIDHISASIDNDIQQDELDPLRIEEEIQDIKQPTVTDIQEKG